MAYVPVPKDLSKIKTKLAFNLTKRQLVCYGFSQLSTSEFLKREMEMHETKNHLLCGWCNKCL